MKIKAFDLLNLSLDRYLILRGLRKNIISVENYQIETWISKNNKPPLLLLHAFGASGKYTWINQILTLSRHFKLIIPNLIYFGNSNMDKKSYSINTQVGALSSMMKHLNIKEFALGGVSYGGTVACELARHNEFIITKMFLSNFSIKNVDSKNWEKIMTQMGKSDRAEILIPSSYQELKKFFNLAMYKKKFLPDFVIKGMYNKYYLDKYEDKKNLVYQYIEETSKMERNPYTFSFPILLLWGENDSISPPYIAEEIKKEIGSNVKLITFKKCGHLPHIERFIKYNLELKKFLTRK
ncbi:MAG: alpha/beta fold hydrolase [Flavobacteriia bacterium]|jgi:pimeloyl-ACP methyl ester carboxylesterase